MDFLATPDLWVLYDTPVPLAAPDSAVIKMWLWTRNQGLAVAGTLALTFVVLPPSAQALSGPGTMYIAPPAGYNVNVRSGPGTQYPVVNTLGRGTPITITGYSEDGWVQLSDRSWVASNLIREAPPSAVAAGTYTAYITAPEGYNVNIRSGPGIQYPAVNTLGQGTPITITGHSEDGWVQLSDRSWVAGNLIRVEARPPVEPTPSPTQPSPPPVAYLQRGSQGVEVGNLQRQLRALGYLPPEVAINGVFDNQTEQAVQQFQLRNGLGVDGVVGPQTLAALSDEAAIANPIVEDPPDPKPPEQPTSPEPTPDPAPGATPPDSGTLREVQVVVDNDQEALVFSGPGTEYDLLGFIPNGAFVIITGRFEENWAELEDNRWIYADWLAL